MGAGRKNQTINIGERGPWSPGNGNSSVSARNLRKNDLGGVIFGCKHSTMPECLSKQLFGLPYSHFSYVRNIRAGLPLFLFNYSDRKLHGIYEAASEGQLYMNAYAWTDDGTERTPFPAQVYIRIRTPCQPLIEKQFKNIIEDNYYSPQHFWFELDHAQTRSLIALFTPSPSPSVTTMQPRHAARGWSDLFPAASKWKATGERPNSEASEPMKDQKPSVDSLDGNKFASLSLDDGDIEHASSGKASSSFEDVDFKEEPVSDWEEWADDNVQVTSAVAGLHVNEEQQILLKQPDHKELESEEEMVLRMLKKLSAEGECSDTSSKRCFDNSGVPCAPRGVDEKREQCLDEQFLVDKKEDNSALSDINHGNGEVGETSTASNLNHENSELVGVSKELREWIANLEKQQVETDREIQQLKFLVMDSGRQIQMLKDRVTELETKIYPPLALDDSLNRYVEQYLGSEDIIYLIGGYNGSSWLSSLDSFSPSLDILTPLKPMSSARSYASAVALDGILYVFGGGNGNLWYNTVECYNRRHDEWTACPPLVHKKGSLAGATLDHKIFAIGGGDGKDCFSDVEMFDPALGRWINNHSMLQKRFAPAAAELHGVLYTVGGFDGKDYLRSAERFDPRQPYWTRLPDMNTRRGCHSLAVLNEKLYAMGGYDGDGMVASVDVFDPRLGSWMMAEPMNIIRGYAAAAVLGDSLFVIGGLKDGKDIVDTVECYREGTGWVSSGWRAIGKRCFCSAIVL